jgi:septum formation protein
MDSRHLGACHLYIHLTEATTEPRKAEACADIGNAIPGASHPNNMPYHESMLILASASLRRHELLLAAGIDHAVRAAEIVEERHPDEPPARLVERLAEEKARAVPCSAEDVVLGADTIVCLDDLVLGKPTDDDDACRMLRLLSGRDHWVYTGICILANGKTIRDVDSTRVSFERMGENEIEEYTRSGEPRDKAGAYAIQGLGSKFIRSIQGCYQNVVGLPVSLVYRYLRDLQQDG